MDFSSEVWHCVVAWAANRRLKQTKNPKKGVQRMKAEQVCKLQENLAKEAIAYLMLYGTAVDVTPYRKAVTQVGMAWGLPIPDTQRWLAVSYTHLTLPTT